MTNITLRKVDNNDINLIYEWRNAPSTREFSFNNQPISFETHIEWFKYILTNNKLFLLIGEQDNNPIGVLRFDTNHKDEAKIDVYLVPGMYGKGLGTDLLSAGIEWAKQNLSVKFLKAEIISENIASLKAFSKAGFNEAYRVYTYSLT